MLTLKAFWWYLILTRGAVNIFCFQHFKLDMSSQTHYVETLLSHSESNHNIMFQLQNISVVWLGQLSCNYLSKYKIFSLRSMNIVSTPSYCLCLSELPTKLCWPSGQTQQHGFKSRLYVNPRRSQVFSNALNGVIELGRQWSKPGS